MTGPADNCSEIAALKSMTLEELWQLFPIELSPYRPEWVTRAEEEIALLHTLLDERHPVITHIGSTAIPGLSAKPIVDILVEMPEWHDTETLVSLMEQNGYICMAKSDGRQSFNKGYTLKGFSERVFHVHVRRSGDNNEILFRDYLREHPRAAHEYEELKLSLLPEFRNDRDGYTRAKGDFVKKIVRLAREKFSRKSSVKKADQNKIFE